MKGIILTLFPGRLRLGLVGRARLPVDVSPHRAPDLAGGLASLAQSALSKGDGVKKVLSESDGASDLAQLNRMITDEGFTGQLAQFQLHEIIQLCCLGQRTGSMSVSKGDQSGAIYFYEGQVVHAVCGDLEGEALDRGQRPGGLTGKVDDEGLAVLDREDRRLRLRDRTPPAAVARARGWLRARTSRGAFRRVYGGVSGSLRLPGAEIPEMSPAHWR